MAKQPQNSNIGSNISAAEEGKLAKPPGLVRKKSAYFYVRRIPETISPLFENRQQLSIALKTTEYRVAVERARKAAAEADKQFQAARLGIAPEPKSKGDGVSLEQLRQAARIHLFKLEKAAPIWDGHRESRHIVEVDLAHMSADAQEIWGASVEGLATELARTQRLLIAPGDRHWSEFCDLVRRAEIEHLERQLDRMKAAPREESHDQLFADVFDHLPAPKPVTRVAVTLGQLIERFENDPTRAHLTESAGKKYILPIAALKEVVGEERLVTDITRADCAEAFELLSALPPHSTKYERYRNKTLREIGEIARRHGQPPLSGGTALVYAHHLSALFNYAIQKGVIEHSPAAKLAVGNKSTASSRRPFSLAELQAIVDALPKWDGGKRGGRLWVPLIALWTGMRLGEIVYLTGDDLQTVDGVEAIVLRPTVERRLKTAGAARVVPIHPELMRLGFGKHVAGVKRSGGRLFPELVGKDQRQVADLFQKRFSYFLKEKVEPPVKGASFHSFRHSFRDAMREAAIPTDAVRALGGWARSGGIEERYGQGTRVATLGRHMDAVDYPGLCFSWVKEKG